MRLWKNGDMARDSNGNILKFIGLDEDADYVFECKKDDEVFKVYYESVEGHLSSLNRINKIDCGKIIKYINPNKYPEYYV
jgi:hypothetical protein